MTIWTAVGDNGSSESMLSETQAHFTRSIRELGTVIDEIKAGDTGRAKDVGALVHILTKALQSALDERAKVDKLRRQDTGSGTGYALDLGAARDEIGRRLARLRDAGDGA